MAKYRINVAVVIPCFRVDREILSLIARIGPEVDKIYLVDDQCPNQIGDFVERKMSNSRLTVLYHKENQGVGGAVITGYLAAIADRAEIIVKLDGDGQMAPELIPLLIGPIQSGHADYVKGNRFHALGDTKDMPPIRFIGNAALSFMSKLSTGYWQMFDPTNGFTAVHASVLNVIPLNKVSRRYFFESDLLFHLNQVRAVVCDLPMKAKYSGEISSLRPLAIILPFLKGNLRNLLRRIGYSYFIHGFSLASLELTIGLVLGLFGVTYGAIAWNHSTETGIPATAGTVMLSSLPILMGLQLVLSWLNFDVAAEPRIPISTVIHESKNTSASQSADNIT